MGYKFTILFFILTALICADGLAQTVIIDEDFSDGDYTNNPTWTDPESKHVVNGSNRLQLDAPEVTDEAVITTSSTAAYGEWEALIQLGFNPSGSNLARFYIISDSPSLKNDLNGYYIQIGDTEDEISLYRQDGSSSTKIIDGTDGLVDSDPVTVRIQITRDTEGNWELWADPNGGSTFSSQGTTTDNTYSQSSYIGLFSDYSSTRHDLFEYDDIKVTKINPPLNIHDVTVVDNQTFDVSFNLDIDPSSVQNSDFSISPDAGSPNNTSISNNVVQLSYDSPIIGGEYTLTVNTIDDTDGNTIDPNTTFEFQFFDSYANGDIIINEFVYDYPTSLSEEYIEIRNTSNKYLNLADWKIGDNNSTDPFGSGPIPIEPDSFLVVSADTTELFNVFGNRAYHEAGFPALNNTTPDAVQLITNNGVKADSLTYNSDWGGTDIALERRSATTSSIYQENWGDSPNANGGTPGLPNEIAPDNTPPQLSDLRIASNQTIKLGFDERLESSTANDETNYSISDISINSVAQTDADSVELSLSSNLQNAQEYTINLSGIEDIFGNAISIADTSFTYYNPTPVDSGDVAINEFMLAPPSNSSEYIEIYNHSSKSLDLQGWTLSDARQNQDVITNSQFIVPPDSFVVITPDNTLESDYPDRATIIMGAFPSLNNGGDAITIRDNNGTLLDSLTYSSNWGDDEVALERRSVDVSAIYQSNWGDAPNGFGTPGIANEISTDTTPPELESLFIQNNQLTLTFSDPLDQTSAENTGNYTLSGGITISDATFASPDSVFLTPGSNLQNNTSYTLSIENVADIFGNVITSTDTTFTFYQVSPSDSGDIAINEFMSAPPSGSSEYIEIYNHSSKSLDLQGWTLSDNGQNADVITSSQFIVPPDSFAVIAPDNTLESNYPDISLVVMNEFPSLNNGGDQIIINNSNATLLDSLAYTSEWGSDEVALERRSIDVAGFYQPNWDGAPNGFGTPGRANEVPTDTEPPQLSSLTIKNSDLLSVTFSERISRSSAENAANYTLSGSLAIASVSFSAPDSTYLQLDSNLQNAVDYTLSIQNVEDIFGNALASTDSTFTFYELSPVSAGDIFINEFSYEPTSGNTEYIELYNPTDKSFNLQGWTLSDNRGNDDVITNTQFVVPPDSFVVIAPDNTLKSEHPGIALVAMSEFPSLNNSGDDIVVSNQNDVQLDSLQYTSAWGGSEVALERRTTDISGIFRENWGNAPNGFGTPGAANEISMDTEPPSLESLFIEQNQVTLTFSEQLDENVAENTGNFILSDDISISDATFSSPDSIFLTTNSNFQNNTNYTLSIENIADIFGNEIAPSDTSFTFYDVSPSDSGDIAINEFMSAPSSNSSEYIELYNHSSKSLNLQGWTLNNNQGSPSVITNEQFIIPPDSFAIIARDNSLQSEYPDIVLTIMEDFPPLKNGGDQIIIRNSNATLLDSLAYTSNWGGNDVALERRSIEVAGFYQSNWDDAPNGFGTPGRANQVASDNNPPLLVNFTVLSNTELELRFSEQLEASTAENTANYTLSGTPAIIGAQLSDNRNVHLVLDDNLQNAVSYKLTIQDITDVFANAIAATDTTFTYYEVSPVSPGDVFVNEFSFDPISGSTEYVEIYNPTSKSFDLREWTLSDNRGNKNVITNSQFVVPPDSFAVITPDNTLLSDYPDIALVSMPGFPALNNSGDDIVLHDNNGVPLDSLRFTSDWGGNEVALERRTPTVSSTFQENWGNSPNGFGTPGSTNLVEPDETPPTFEELSTNDQSSLQLLFSERITSSSASNQANYQISPSRDIQLIAANDDSVQLFLSQDLESGTTYDVTVSNISDVFGNTLESTTKQIEYLQIDQAKHGDIVINEILYNPGSSGKADFIELYNTSTKNFDLTNWVVGDAVGTTSINQNIKLRAGGYIVLTGSNIFATNVGSNGYAIGGFPSLNNNTPDAVYLRNQNGVTIDSLQYSQSWGGNEEGTSLERKDPLAASNDASNWETSTSENGSSGGQQNITFSPDTNPPEVIFSKVRSDGIYEVQFNEFIKLTNNLKFLLGDHPLNITSFDSTNGNVIILNSPQSQSKQIAANGTSITVQNLTDVKGNTAQQSEVAIAQPMNTSEKDLVINEIMYNPLDEPDDNQPDQSEYIELCNTRNYAISLEGLVLHDAPDEDGNVRELQPVSSTAKWVPAQGQVLIYADEATTFDESMTANFFDLESPNLQSIMRIDRSSLSLASSGDAIFISDSTGANIDSVFYDESWQNPNLIDTRGVSLERIAPGGPSNDDSNWGSSVNPKGGTPNQENSIYQEEGQVPDETGISFTPNPFTPDGDGNNDNLFINYKLDHQDYLIKVHIYDRYGRMVRELADGKQAGFEGQLIWDGRKGDGGRNRIGIYIVVFEAYDSASGSDKAFKKTVVLARQLN